MRRETALWLGGLTALVVFLALEPNYSFALFGSDSGEYYRLTADLLTTGHLPVGAAYQGWGVAYPDFPGLFLLAGAGAGAVGLNAYTSLTLVVPVVAALSILPLYLLFRRLYPNDVIALLGAAFASVAMPRMFSIAHPAPLALGDLLCVAALWMFIESRRDARWYLPLALTSGALIVTHHLSTFFFALSALGGLLFLELWRPGLWSRRFPARELAFLGAFATGTLLYWYYGTTTFVSAVIVPGLGGQLGQSFVELEAASLGAVLAAGALLGLRRRRFEPRAPWVRVPSTRKLARDMSVLGLLIFGGIAIVLIVPLPGTSQLTTPAALLWFSPVLLLGIFAAGSRYAPRAARLGPFALSWLLALGIGVAAVLAASALLASHAGFVEAIPASRFVEYLVVPIGLLSAIGLASIVERIGERAGRRAFLAASTGVLVLVAANAAIVYPPQADFGGFQEGYTHGDAALWAYVGLSSPPTMAVASDHRLSSMVFGVDGNPATWGSTPALFTGTNRSAAFAELNDSPAPYAEHPIDLVVVDSVMHSGVALSPSAAARPLSSAAIGWFGHLPFLPLYESGEDVTYLVDAPAA